MNGSVVSTAYHSRITSGSSPRWPSPEPVTGALLAESIPVLRGCLRSSCARGVSAFNATHEEVSRRGVHEEDVTAAEAAGQEDSVGALDEVGELLLGDAAADDAVVRLV